MLSVSRKQAFLKSLVTILLVSFGTFLGNCAFWWLAYLLTNLYWVP